MSDADKRPDVQSAKGAPKGGSASAAADLRQHAHDLVDDVQGLSEAAKRLAREKVREVREGGIDRVEAYEDEIVAYVRAHPLRSILIAAAAGAVLSSLLRR